MMLLNVFMTPGWVHCLFNSGKTPITLWHGSAVPEYFKDDSVSQWKSGKFDPHSPKNSWTDRHQICMGDYVGNLYPMQNSIMIRLPLSSHQICENSCKRLTRFSGGEGVLTTAYNRFLRSVHIMTSFHARICLLGVSKTTCYISTPLSQKMEFFFQFLMGLGNIQIKKALYMAMLTYKLPLNVILAPWKLLSE